MITNRPRPPVDIPVPPRMFEYPRDAGPYSYFTNNQLMLRMSGIQVASLSSAGTWQEAFNEQGAGVLEFFCLAVENRSNQTRTMGARLVVDNSVLLNSTNENQVTRNGDSAVVMVGGMFFHPSQGYPISFANDNMHFKRNVYAEIYASSLQNFDFILAYKYRATGNPIN